MLEQESLGLDFTSERLSDFGRRMQFLTNIKKKRTKCEWLSTGSGCQEIRESPPIETFKTHLENALSNLI